ncbi:hypothetical protein QBC39DRAFT_46657 [Podospora conica]|nr:hypothetical protein QBC39DRAFT_46657 [Schizothecium conicum]
MTSNKKPPATKEPNTAFLLVPTLRRSARIKAAKERREGVTPKPAEKARPKNNRPFYSHERARHGQLVPVKKWPPPHGQAHYLASDHWFMAAYTRLETFQRHIVPYTPGVAFPQVRSLKYTLKPCTPSREWWLSQPISLLRYWMDIMGVFCYVDYCKHQSDGPKGLREPETLEDYATGMRQMGVKLGMYKVKGPQSEDQDQWEWELTYTNRPYIFILQEVYDIFRVPLMADRQYQYSRARGDL